MLFFPGLLVLYLITKFSFIVSSNLPYYFTTFSGIFSIIFHLFQAISFTLALYSFAHILILGNVFSITAQYILYLKCRQNSRLLCFAGLKLNCLILRLFKQEMIVLLQYLGALNRIFGPLFIVYLLLNCPMAAYLLGLILYSRLGHQEALLVGVLVLSQLNGILFIHYSSAALAKALAAPCRLLHQLAPKVRIAACRRAVGRLICQFSSQTPYGLTYGKYGLITMQSFLKVRSFSLYAKNYRKKVFSSLFL